MNIEEILKLKEAGFSAEEITQLSSVMHTETTDSNVKAESSATPDLSRFEAIEKSIAKLAETIQSNNIKDSTITPAKEESIDDICNSIINGGKE